MEVTSRLQLSLTKIGLVRVSLKLPKRVQSRIECSGILLSVASKSLASLRIFLVPFGFSEMPYNTTLNLWSEWLWATTATLAIDERLDWTTLAKLGVRGVLISGSASELGAMLGYFIWETIFQCINRRYLFGLVQYGIVKAVKHRKYRLNTERADKREGRRWGRCNTDTLTMTPHRAVLTLYHVTRVDSWRADTAHRFNFLLVLDSVASTETVDLSTLVAPLEESLGEAIISFFFLPLFAIAGCWMLKRLAKTQLSSGLSQAWPARSYFTNGRDDLFKIADLSCLWPLSLKLFTILFIFHLIFFPLSHLLRD